MKKIILSVVFLLALTSLSHAADKKNTAVKESVDHKNLASNTSNSLISASYAALLEENSRLKMQTEALSTRVEDLNSKLEYSQMMHATITNLQDAALAKTLEDAQCQLDFVRMMNATLLNLQKDAGR